MRTVANSLATDFPENLSFDLHSGYRRTPSEP
jgi:hypothetical protein